MKQIRPNLEVLLRPTGLAMAIAVAGVLIAYIVGTALLGASMVVDLGGAPQEVSAITAIAFTVVLMALGGITAALIGAFSRHASRVFTGLAIGSAVLMSIGPIVGSADPATTVTLLAMHGVALIAALATIPRVLEVIEGAGTAAELPLAQERPRAEPDASH